MVLLAVASCDILTIKNSQLMSVVGWYKYMSELLDCQFQISI